MIDIEKMAAAIEADLGESIPGLRESIAQLENGGGRVLTAEQLEVRQSRSALGLSQVDFSHAGVYVARLGARSHQAARRGALSHAIAGHASTATGRITAKPRITGAFF